MDSARARRPWHSIELDALLEDVDATETGLGSAEAAARLRLHGPNTLPRESPPSIARIFARQFKSPLIYVLAAAAAMSAGIGELTDAGFILAVLLLNAVIGTIQEWRAEKSNRALQLLLRTRATVVRDGEPREIDAEEVVVGDLAWLEPGARVPADLRLLSTQALEIDESLLTGESLPVHKDTAWRGADDAPLGDRANMAHAGSVVTRGRARGVVVATGGHTEIGRLATGTAEGGGRAPLLVRLERFTRAVAVVVLIAASVVGAVGVLARGYSPAEMFLVAVALAVSAIPEGLPVALTVALAIATRRMSRRGVIVRRLAAVEGLGSCSYVATDKTGTLTVNELTVRAVYLPDGRSLAVTGEGYAPTGHVQHDERQVLPGSMPELDRLARAAVLCNEGALHSHDDAWTWRGDPTDVALLAFAHKLGWAREVALEQLPEVGAIPFEPERKYAASFHRVDGRVFALVKGAPERVAAMCAWPFGEDERETMLRRAASLAASGHRVLALADGEQGDVEGGSTPPEPSGLVFLGLVALLDPLRPGVKEAVAAAQRAGVRVVMVTGDHPATALAIARELGFASRAEEVVTGVEVAASDEAALRAAIGRARVFARMAPDDKLRVVNAARAAGMFVAVTGDGVNDAPALRAANIGVAMGRSGTDVAREASELVIADDDFSTIVAGIEEGRVAYDNVRKVIFLLISTGAAEVVLVAATLVAGLPLPLLPAQLLWLNLVTNGIQDVALAFEPREGDVLSRPPRAARERIFDRLMIERTLVSAVAIGGVGFVAFSFMIESGMPEAEARNALLLLMVLFENVQIGNSRSETRSIFVLSPFRSPVLLAGTITAFLVHVAAMHLPFMQSVLGTAPVGARTWIVLAALALTAAIASEAHKWTWALRHRGATHASHGRERSSVA